MITLDEFKKIDFRVAKIVAAQKIERSQKLLKLQLDMGEEQRQIVSGISEFYEPESLIGKEIVIIANLAPRVILGIESQGMLLAADADGKPVLVTVDSEVAPGTKIG